MTRAEVLSLLRPFVKLSPSPEPLDIGIFEAAEAEDEAETGEDGSGTEDTAQSGHSEAEGSIPPSPLRFSDVADAEVELAAEDMLSAVIDRSEERALPDDALAVMADDLTTLLATALDLFALVGKADEHDDPGRYDQPSIWPHDQNLGFRNWTILVDLLWRGWQRVDAVAPDRSRALVRRWQTFRYPLFRRLVLAAKAASRNWTTSEKMEALLDGTD